MPRRKRSRSSLLAPAGDLIKKLSDHDSRLRRRILKVALWAFGIWFTFSLFVGTYGLPRIARLHLQKGALENSNRDLTVELIDAARQRYLLLTDSGYIEEVARSRYYLSHPNEIIYRYRGR